MIPLTFQFFFGRFSFRRFGLRPLLHDRNRYEIRPLHDRVVVKRLEGEEKNAKGTRFDTTTSLPFDPRGPIAAGLDRSSRCLHA